MLPVHSELPEHLAAGLLHVFILGPGLGESIVVRTPQANWLVIDSHSTLADGILATFILKRYQVTQIEALVLTHPDEDHYKGLAELCDWGPPPRKVAATANLFDADVVTPHLPDHLIPANAELAQQRKGGAATYTRFSDLVRDGVSQGIWLRQGILLHQEELVGFRIECVAPDDQTLAGIAGGISSSNQQSAVLAISWGQSRYILAADLPADEWQRLPPDLAAHRAIKVPHHGSEGSISATWTAPQANRRHWVATPYNRARNRPPQPAALRQLLQKEHLIYLTAVPSRYGHCAPPQCLVSELQNSSAMGPPPGDSRPATDCVVYLSYNKQGELHTGMCLPGALAVLPG